jgi:2-keto-4-pentenoate hydratase/2-oxohepta-3-ene-1,7-dioic acid hydratase in catechol pathway
MRWARFDDNGSATFAIVEGEYLHPVRGTPFDDWERHGGRRPILDAKLLVPVIPGSFYACGLNYDAHVREVAKKHGVTPRIPERPEVGYRSNSALIAQNETIVIPSDATEQIHYEGEIVVVIGKKAKDISEAEALSHVFGYTIGNDVSERSWQKTDRTMWRAKNSDTFKPMGPWIETNLNIDDLMTRVRVNNDLKIEFRTADMLFGVPRVLSELSRYITLHPGDVVWMGTDGASVNLQNRDVVEIEIDGIGTLRNPVIREAGKGPDSNEKDF